ncbi:hypothetical protein D1BOALGB6SA_9865 [Olavius sp. associated proteobacterium Delta 1]|nr:hypothetical protein D1BOALGB6SA_9865 [Olavius sp. associated proteobacterium Delta 1]
MRINLHIAITPFKNDSRILKESKTILENNIADKIIIVALWEEGELKYQHIDRNRDVWRVSLRTRGLPKNLFFQLFKYVEFTIRVLAGIRNRKISIVNCHDLLVLSIGVLIKKIYGPVLVYDTHELETEKNGLTQITKPLSKILEKILIKYTDAIIVVSNAIADEYRKMYKFGKPYVVLNAPTFSKVKKHNIFRQKFKISEHARIFLYQGNLMANRGIEQILEAFMNINNPEKNTIIFLGYGPLTDKILGYAKRHSNIYFHKAVPPGVLLDYTSSADVGMSLIEASCLSYYYCLPNKFFEYIMAGLPVLISNLPEMKKIIEAEKIGTVIKDITPEEIRRTIELLDDDTLSMYKKNTAKSAEKYNWERQEKVLIEAYQGLF